MKFTNWKSGLIFVFLMSASCNLAQESEQVDVTQYETPLPVESQDWNAFLIYDNKATGIWTVNAYPVFKQYASHEVVGVDDKGRCIICVSYSGKWTPFRIIEDGKWLGGLAHGDIDPRIPGEELYTGGQNGNLYQVVPYAQGALDCRLIAHFPGLEIHTLAVGELDPSNSSKEILVFTNPGSLYEVTPTGENGNFVTQHVQDLSGRVRDALILPHASGKIPEIATVSRDGKLELLQWNSNGAAWNTIYKDAMGKGRIALRPAKLGPETVLYSTHDDGRVLRHQRIDAMTWKTETIYLSAQGPRGVAAGQFHADPQTETIAVFGYNKKVQLLSKINDQWKMETIFVDTDKGHWLSAAELDGRNNTDELIGSGYSGRIFMLVRPPGYGLSAN